MYTYLLYVCLPLYIHYIYIFYYIYLYLSLSLYRLDRERRVRECREHALAGLRLGHPSDRGIQDAEAVVHAYLSISLFFSLSLSLYIYIYICICICICICTYVCMYI